MSVKKFIAWGSLTLILLTVAYPAVALSQNVPMPILYKEIASEEQPIYSVSPDKLSLPRSLIEKREDVASAVKSHILYQSLLIESKTKSAIVAEAIRKSLEFFSLIEQNPYTSAWVKDEIEFFSLLATQRAAIPLLTSVAIARDSWVTRAHLLKRPEVTAAPLVHRSA